MSKDSRILRNQDLQNPRGLSEFITRFEKMNTKEFREDSQDDLRNRNLQNSQICGRKFGRSGWKTKKSFNKKRIFSRKGNVVCVMRVTQIEVEPAMERVPPPPLTD